MKTRNKIYVLNGPNLNLLGLREPAIYGSLSLLDIESLLQQSFPEIEFNFFQSNHEGALLDQLHAIFNLTQFVKRNKKGRQNVTDTTDEILGIIINPGALSHYSIALHDALKVFSIPVIEVHLSNIAAREEFRKVSITAGACTGSISGFGVDGYLAAVQLILNKRPQ